MRPSAIRPACLAARPALLAIISIAPAGALRAFSASTDTRPVPPASQPAQEKAETLEKLGDFAGAARAYETVVAADPNNPNVLLRSGRLWLQADYYEPAARHLARLVEMDARSRDGWLALGETHFRSQAFQPALAAFRRAETLGDADGRAANGIGAVHFSMGERDVARTWFEKAARANPRLPGPRHGLGKIALDEGDHDCAIQWFDECIALEPRDAETHFRKGLALRRKGDLPGAESSFRAAIAEDAMQLGARQNLGQVLIAMGRPAEGKAALENHGRIARGSQQLTFARNSLGLEPSSPTSRVALGDALFELGLYSEALMHFREATRSKKAPAAAFLGAARACRALSEFAAMRQYASRAVAMLERDPAAPREWLAEARQLMETTESRPGY